MADIVAQVITEYTPTAPNATFALNFGRLQGRAIKALLLWGTKHPVSDDPDASNGICVFFGFTDGTNQIGGCFTARDGVGTSSTSSRARSDVCLTIVDPVTKTVIVNASIVFCGNGTAQLNFTTVDTAPYRFFALAIGGDDVSAKVLKTGSMTGSTADPFPTTAITGVGFPPNFALAFQSMPVEGGNFDATTVRDGSGYMTIGYGTGPDEQFSWDHLNRAGQSLHDNEYGTVINDRLAIGRSAVGTSSGQHVRIYSMDADGITLENRRSFTQELGLLLMEARNGAEFKAFSHTAPATAQQKSVTLPTFPPGLVFNVMSEETTFYRELAINGAAYGNGISAFDGAGNSGGASWASVVLTSNMDNECDAQEKAIYGGHATTVSKDAQRIAANFVSMDALGFTLDYEGTNGDEPIIISFALTEGDIEAEASGEFPDVRWY